MQTGTYTLKVVSEFSAAHALRGYIGDCARIHGHNWKLEVELEAKQLNEIGIAIDFKLVKALTKQVTEKLDHYYLNEVPPFDEINPTAENVVAWIFGQIAPLMTAHNVKLSSLTLWENDRSSVKFSPGST